MNIPYYITAESYIVSDRTLPDLAKIIYGVIKSSMHDEYVIDYAVLSDFLGREEPEIEKSIRILISSGHLPEYIIRHDLRAEPEFNPVEEEEILAVQTWIANNAPIVNKMKSPLTGSEILKLKKDFSIEEIKDILLAMHNTSYLLKRYSSTNLTARKWMNNNRRRLGIQDRAKQSII